ncbi:2-dehydro-3-deoxyphosphooctonate aldolase [Flavobacterium psychrophilum]|uniref:Probable lipoprotein n=3 Tax=Flavobacterium psychrophilum TaxID=96345 RepID=A6H079_FLAPJ|nr:2-dehydro-3-deoxyphosphooctonate aldolase [Flavobacterium psychrophilum]AIG30440.1 2-dehydro-3-deoxyphosphooctonate aldolase [Flavobacterium psychrophilum]AIG32715.1 2-dehydro-3-deoxyphosphooctonate aldolase [Flavobacterium psychrophilum]AIG34870.1 2-dehydro-3-deoxyphosphooctonate aldolase [Flavobacterium psychrophilum]AIG37235.1 2-dehydro-3-deoxyphosphooctonate aldolase [Flavobacterium psychrophilum]AIG39499.1 2-dehydro-3-deoxyphosphooctonate aldolase [Flavobacterium psychrophilum]
MKKNIISCLIILLMSSCISTKLTIQNINELAIKPALNEDFSSFIITKNATSKKYGYDPDYPVNVNFTSEEDGLNNQIRFLKALAGPKGEKIKYTQKDPCCPFPSKRANTGAGIIDVFEITWEGQNKPILLYINKFEKGELFIPIGLSARK